MANYICAARSNYFRVKDLDAFKKALAQHDISVGGWKQGATLVLHESPENKPEGSIAIFAYEGWPDMEMLWEGLAQGAAEVACGAYEPLPDDSRAPGKTYDETNLPCDVCLHPGADHDGTGPRYWHDLTTLVAAHLIPGDVAVLAEAGFEAMRWVNGFAVAVNSDGETETVDLDHIYKKAAHLGTTVTKAHY